MVKIQSKVNTRSGEGEEPISRKNTQTSPHASKGKAEGKILTLRKGERERERKVT